MNIYDALAPLYVPLCRAVFGRSQHGVLRSALQHVDLQAYSQIIVLGCGPGYNLPLLRHRFGGKIVCVEKSAAMLQRAQKNIHSSRDLEHNNEITWICDDVLQDTWLNSVAATSQSSEKTLVIAEYFFDQFDAPTTNKILANLNKISHAVDLLAIDFSATALTSKRMRAVAAFFYLTGILPSLSVLHVAGALRSSSLVRHSNVLVQDGMFEAVLAPCIALPR